MVCDTRWTENDFVSLGIACSDVIVEEINKHRSEGLPTETAEFYQRQLIEMKERFVKTFF